VLTLTSVSPACRRGWRLIDHCRAFFLLCGRISHCSFLLFAKAATVPRRQVDRCIFSYKRFVLGRYFAPSSVFYCAIARRTHPITVRADTADVCGTKLSRPEFPSRMWSLGRDKFLVFRCGRLISLRRRAGHRVHHLCRKRQLILVRCTNYLSL